jgi:hypothetical protein
VTSAYATEFIGAAQRAFDQLGRLVDEVMGWKDDDRAMTRRSPQ